MKYKQGGYKQPIILQLEPGTYSNALKKNLKSNDRWRYEIESFVANRAIVRSSFLVNDDINFIFLQIIQ